MNYYKFCTSDCVPVPGKTLSTFVSFGDAPPTSRPSLVSEASQGREKSRSNEARPEKSQFYLKPRDMNNQMHWRI
jgi:hypothetical protein